MKTTTDNKILREHLLDLLLGESAHVNFEAAVKDMPAALRGKRAKGGAHSPWEVLEHLRITQWDILEFIRNPKHVSPEFPAGYWPATPDGDWDASAEAFRVGLKEIAAMVADPSADVLAVIPHCDGKTLLREVLLLADHNSYHLGQLIEIRRALGAWG